MIVNFFNSALLAWIMFAIASLGQKLDAIPERLGECPGVVSDFRPFVGTGAWGLAQHLPDLEIWNGDRHAG